VSAVCTCVALYCAAHTGADLYCSGPVLCGLRPCTVRSFTVRLFTVSVGAMLVAHHTSSLGPILAQVTIRSKLPSMDEVLLNLLRRLCCCCYLLFVSTSILAQQVGELSNVRRDPSRLIFGIIAAAVGFNSSSLAGRHLDHDKAQSDHDKAQSA
jgi:hypothetical protein